MKAFSHIPDQMGFYGAFGGAYIPELLHNNVAELEVAFAAIQEDPKFHEAYSSLLKQYVGRPTPLYFAPNYSERFGTQIYFKREDLCHTGAHKVNNTIGQALLATRMGKTTIVAET